MDAAQEVPGEVEEQGMNFIVNATVDVETILFIAQHNPKILDNPLKLEIKGTGRYKDCTFTSLEDVTAFAKCFVEHVQPLETKP
jgi:hypothetical protein